MEEDGGGGGGGACPAEERAGSCCWCSAWTAETALSASSTEIAPDLTPDMTLRSASPDTRSSHALRSSIPSCIFLFVRGYYSAVACALSVVVEREGSGRGESDEEDEVVLCLLVFFCFVLGCFIFGFYSRVVKNRIE